MKYKILLFAHAGSGNRGCEALARSSASIFHRSFNNAEIYLASVRSDQDLVVQIPHINSIVSAQLKDFNKSSLLWWIGAVALKMGISKLLFETIHNSPTISVAQKMDICISIGGDTYCYGYNNWLYAIDRKIKKTHSKLVLWGCSIEPEIIDSSMIKDLNAFDLISARESITYNALLEKCECKNICLYPDPAFTMPKDESPLPDGWKEGEMIGINISPLIMAYEKTSNLAYINAVKLVEYIIDNTNYGIAFIPHVTWDFNNDLEPLTSLFEKFKHTGRIVLIGSQYNAPQIKGFIARCRMFVGARTHATIAAYSTFVPTLVVGYSVKARGIARDIFGSEENMVIPVQALRNENDLTNSFKMLQENEHGIRNHLQDFMPSYIEKAWQAGAEVRKLIEK